MDIILGVVGVALIVAGVAFLIDGLVNGDGNDKIEWGKAGIGLLGIILGLSTFIPVMYLYRLERITEMEAFQNYTISAYETTIDETRNLISVDTCGGTLIEGSIEKLEIASDVADRLVELRDEIKQYNKDLAYCSKMNSIPVVQWSFPSVEHLDYIEVVA